MFSEYVKVVFCTCPAREVETIKKQVCEKFRQLGLQITADANVKTVDFLDVTFDLSKEEYEPTQNQEKKISTYMSDQTTHQSSPIESHSPYKPAYPTYQVTRTY